MSIEQSDVIDMISADRITGEVTLTVSNHFDWSTSTGYGVWLRVAISTGHCGSEPAFRVIA
jgi:hypothetical protein